MDTKKIGILGGISAESTIKYYDHIIKAYYRRKHDYYYPEIVIYSLNFQRFTDFENNNDRNGYIAEIMTGITALQQAGVDFILMAANSPHAVFNKIKRRATVPMLSIVQVTAQEAQRLGLTKLLLIGIKFTMQASFYPDTCQQYGIDLLVPSPAEQDEIDHIIFSELTIGLFAPKSKSRLLEIIGQYNVDGVILGCTELPLILGPKDADIPLLNTLSLHAEAALNKAIGEI